MTTSAVVNDSSFRTVKRLKGQHVKRMMIAMTVPKVARTNLVKVKIARVRERSARFKLDMVSIGIY